MKKGKGFVAINKVNWRELGLVEVKGGYTMYQPYSIRNGIVFRFPKGMPEEYNVVYVVFDTDREGARKVVSIYDFGPDRSRIRKNKKGNILYLKYAEWATRNTGMGGHDSSEILGKIVFQMEGHNTSPTGSHGKKHMVFLCEEPVAVLKSFSRSNRGNEYEYEQTI